MIRSSLLVGIALAVAFAACSNGGGSLPVPAADYYDDYAEALCILEIRCGVLQDEARCETATKDALGFAALRAQLVADVADGKIVFNEANAGICVDSIAAGACVDLAASPDQVPVACDTIMSGTIQTDGFCFNSSECQIGFCNISGSQSMTCATGTCSAPLQISAVGGPCDDELHTCNSSSYCSSAGMCTALAGEGVTCASSAECQAPLVCNMGADSGSGGLTCNLLPALGESCTDSCAGLGVVCNPSSTMCESMVDVGQSCAMAVCKTDSSCDLTTMLCKATTAPTPLANGASCSSAGAICQSGYCDPANSQCAAATACTL